MGGAACELNIMASVNAKLRLLWLSGAAVRTAYVDVVGWALV